MSYLVETNVFSELAKSRPDAQVVTWLREHEQELYVSSIAAWDKKGTTVPSLDSQIAATAHRHGLTIVTRNVADFQSTGIRILNPFST